MGAPKKSFRIDLEEKRLRNSKMFVDDVIFLYIFTSSQEVKAF